MQSFKDSRLRINHKGVGKLAALLLKDPSSDATQDGMSELVAKRRKLSFGDGHVNQKIVAFEDKIEISSVASGWDDALIKTNKQIIDELDIPITKPRKYNR